MMKNDEKLNKKQLSAAAQRALNEAEERRLAAKNREAKLGLDQKNMPENKEVGGRKGPDPVRFGDWEKAGIASDF